MTWKAETSSMDFQFNHDTTLPFRSHQTTVRSGYINEKETISGRLVSSFFPFFPVTDVIGRHSIWQGQFPPCYCVRHVQEMNDEWGTVPNYSVPPSPTRARVRTPEYLSISNLLYVFIRFLCKVANFPVLRRPLGSIFKCKTDCGSGDRTYVDFNPMISIKFDLIPR